MKDALQGVDDPARYVAQMRQRLMPGGSFSVIVTTPDPRSEVELLQTLRVPVNPLDATAVTAMLRATGFAVNRSHVQLTRTMTWADYLELERSRHLPALFWLNDPQLKSAIGRLRPQRPVGECVEVSQHFDIVTGSRGV